MTNNDGIRPDNGPTRFAVIIGAMKAGTSSLFHYLADHPRIAPCRVKEPKFFIRDERLAGGLAGYQALWESWDPVQHAIALEASTGYTKYPVQVNAAERIARFAETEGVTFRFLYIMRDPVDKFISRYMHARSGGWTTERPGAWIHGEERLHLMRYASQLDEYYQRFPADTLHLMLFEDLRDHPEATIARALRFLGLEPEPADQPAERPAHNRTADKRVLPIWMLKAKQLGVLDLYRTLVPESLRLRVNKALTRSGEERMELTPDEEKALIDALAPDLIRLEEVYGVDISRWPSVRDLRARI